MSTPETTRTATGGDAPDGQPASHATGGQPASDAAEDSSLRALLPALSTRLTWTLFLASLAAGALTATGRLVWPAGPLVAVDGLTLLLWSVVTFVSGIVQSFSRRYMAADERLAAFFARLFALTVVVGAMTAANSVVLFAGCWAAMGWVMADLVGHLRNWPQAQAARRRARRSFGAGAALLAAGLGVLAAGTGELTVDGILAGLPALSPAATLLAAGLLVAAAMVQSALIPFHGWLRSSMTAPTPASAMMHAGFVNGGGILLARFAPVFAGETAVMVSIVVFGAVSALLAQLWMIVQTDAKGTLACSTVAQMGMMILQCGLGFFTAAVTHLVLHGFYKAYLFLSAGSNVGRHRPADAGGGSPSAAGLLTMLVTPVLGGVLFATLTGKQLLAPTSGTVLVVVVVLSVFQGTRNLVGHASLSPLARAVGVPLVTLPAIALYAGVYNGITAAMHAVPAATSPTPLTAVHVIVAGLFVAAYVAVETGLHRRSRRAYVAALNAARPAPATVLTDTGEYDDR